MSEPQLPPRPEPRVGPAEHVQRWLAWFGMPRLVLTAVSVLVVSAGLYWLVRTEPPPVEASLPVTAASAPDVTLPPPVPENTPLETTEVFVHVAGAVVVPGVHQLDSGARVVDAVRAAGGPAVDADLNGLNLATPLVDGQRVYVPVVGEVDPATVPTGAVPADGPAGASAATSDPIDVNTATAAQLETLPGVGPATAAAIIDDRERNGPFASVDDLERVTGIGPAKLAAIRDLVTA